MRKGPVRAAFVIAGTVAALCSPPVLAEGSLRVCLNEDIPLYSLHQGNEASGFDLAVAEAVAKRLDRKLEIQWFETKLEMDSSLTVQANALLSDKRCDLVAGYPLIKGTLGKPRVEIARLPGFDGGKPEDRRRRVTLGTLVPTRPYHRSVLTIVVNGGTVTKPIASLADLDGLKIGLEGGTLGDAILMTYRDGRFVNQITHLIPERQDPLAMLDAGAFDATMVNLRRLDAYVAKHPETKIKATGFYHRIGVNMGFVGLAANAALIEAVDGAIGALEQQGDLPKLAAAAKLTYVPPREPKISDNIGMSDLAEK
ncbi:ABC transporter substrate-binding protein [Reyranella sp. CPCC 100927]|uniref:substrate-binding periplasmic protein n=1 Tax=Reyranella sp. CPCC 100927 TaxID=2599616 RepID=UPI0011B60CB9|nr:transporter substrate-binding domain-containing protein [Reyranella sp. CPCC 100927]TWT10657.1 transporter substrate-binding domain-containing protein [Reyranella sp. CPCC 100927]